MMNLKTLKTNFFNKLAKFPNTERQSYFKHLCRIFLDLKPIDIVLNEQLEISEEQYEQFEAAIQKLNNDEPIQYVVGSTYFFGLEFKVNPSVLIPRPESEELVAWILTHFKTTDSPVILDLGTGSGCLAISLAKHLPHAKIVALDISHDALKVAQYNAQTHSVSITFLEDDMLELMPLDIVFDIIVSNPPYVCLQEKSKMKANVLEHEPHLALFVKDDNPLEFYKAIRQTAIQYLKPGGLAFMEINEAFGRETFQLFRGDSFEKTQLKQDTFGKDRLLKTQKK